MVTPQALLIPTLKYPCSPHLVPHEFLMMTYVIEFSTPHPTAATPWSSSVGSEGAAQSWSVKMPDSYCLIGESLTLTATEST